jgi:hypothetical protein
MANGYTNSSYGPDANTVIRKATVAPADMSQIWNAAKKYGTKAQDWAKSARNFLATGDFSVDTPDSLAENITSRVGLGNALGDMYKERMNEQERDRAIAEGASDRYAALAQKYPELWQAKRKAAFQSGALSALGGT